MRFHWALGLAALIIGLGCDMPETQQPKVAAYVPKFQYEVPKAAAPGSAQVSIAVITTQAGKVDNQFQSRFVQDLQNVLVARGYSVKGPFQTKDEMTYSDKKGSDFILTYSLSNDFLYNNVVATRRGGFNVNLPPEEEARLWDGTYVQNLLGQNVKHVNGYASFFKGDLATEAKINILLVESMSGEKLWTKTVDISSEPAPFETSVAHAVRPGEAPADSMSKAVPDASMLNSINKSLDGIYNNAFTSIWNHLDPREMQGIKRQAKEIKSRKVY